MAKSFIDVVQDSPRTFFELIKFGKFWIRSIWNKHKIRSYLQSRKKITKTKIHSNPQTLLESSKNVLR